MFSLLLPSVFSLFTWKQLQRIFFRLGDWTPLKFPYSQGGVLIPEIRNIFSLPLIVVDQWRGI